MPKLGLESLLENLEGLLEKIEPTKLIPIFLKMVLPSIKFLRAINGNREDYKAAKEIYLNNDELHMYFDNNPNTWFVDKSYPEDLEQLFKELSIGDIPRAKLKHKGDKGYVIIQSSHGWHKRGLNGFDPSIEVDGLEYALKHPTVEKSSFIWNRIAIANSDCIRGIVESSSRQTFENSKKKKQTSEKFGHLLIDNHWLPDKQGKFYKPSEFELNDLPDSFVRDEKLAKLLRMQRDEIREIEKKTGGKFVPIEEYKEFQQWKKSQSGSNENSDENKIEEYGEPCPDKIDYKDKLIVSFNKPGQTELQETTTDKGKVINDVRRAGKIQKGIEEDKANEPSPEDRFKKIPRKVWEGKNYEARIFLQEQYNGKCQICGQTFIKRNGQPYFEGLYLVSRTNARWIDRTGNILCLCANHSAQLQHGSVEAGDINKQIQSFKTEKEGGKSKPVLRIKLCGEECIITYTEKHLFDLRELLRASESQK